jgi:hypothetical protein
MGRPHEWYVVVPAQPTSEVYGPFASAAIAEKFRAWNFAEAGRVVEGAVLKPRRTA